MAVEIGAPICCNRKCRLGQVSRGSKNNVLIKMACPKGTNAVGTWHTHPGGSSRPSPADIRNVRQAGLSWVCISGKQGLKCQRVR